MKVTLKIMVLTLALAVLAAACSTVENLQIPSDGPADIVVPTPMPAAEVIFTVRPPETTPAEASLKLILLDQVTGLYYNAQSIPMTRLDDGRWQARLTPANGSLLRYRYSLENPNLRDEVAADGNAIHYRLIHVSGPEQANDSIAAWAGGAYPGFTGRVLGRVFDAFSGAPLQEVLINAAGLTTFSDSEGAFRLDGLMPGEHRLSIFTMDGSYLPVQQGAVIASDSSTPVELGLTPAQSIQVTFDVTVPSDTIPGLPLKIAGNTRQLGDFFTSLQGGLSSTGSSLPTMDLAAPGHYTYTTTLFAGTDLRYKYTLGDGLWNAERDENNAFLTHQVILPDHDIVFQDTVASWHTKDRGSVLFHVRIPEITPEQDQLSIQFLPFVWFEPILMWPLDEGDWYYVLRGPLGFNDPISYRYCRNLECGSADEFSTAIVDSNLREFTGSTARQDLQDEVLGWIWWNGEIRAKSVVAPEQVDPRPGFEAGMEFVPAYQPTWLPFMDRALGQISKIGGNAVILTPTWIWEYARPFPVLSFDPSHTPFAKDLSEMVKSAHEVGLEVALRATTQPRFGTMRDWWLEAPGSLDWWGVWFEEYRSFAITLAQQAADAGADKLVLGGPEVVPALPGGVLPDGSTSEVPEDSAERWEELIREVRHRFAGRLAFEIEFGAQLQAPPPFLDSVDEIHLYWHPPLSESEEVDFAQLHANATAQLDTALQSASILARKPLVLSVEYLSVQGSASGCLDANDLRCHSPSAFDLGADPDLTLNTDFQSQADAINAMLLEVSGREEVVGFYLRRYNPITALQDKSASVHGKPAGDVIWYWYPRLTGSLAR